MSLGKFLRMFALSVALLVLVLSCIWCAQEQSATWDVNNWHQLEPEKQARVPQPPGPVMHPRLAGLIGIPSVLLALACFYGLIYVSEELR